MSAPEVENQPDQVPSKTENEASLTVPEAAVPDEKSDVEIDPNAPEQTRKYGKGDTVHMSITKGGVRTKGTYTIYSSRVDRSRSFWEYKLQEGNGSLYDGGKWVRERELKLEKRRG